MSRYPTRARAAQQQLLPSPPPIPPPPSTSSRGRGGGHGRGRGRGGRPSAAAARAAEAEPDSISHTPSEEPHDPFQLAPPPQPADPAAMPDRRALRCLIRDGEQSIERARALLQQQAPPHKQRPTSRSKRSKHSRHEPSSSSSSSSSSELSDEDAAAAPKRTRPSRTRTQLAESPQQQAERLLVSSKVHLSSVGLRHMHEDLFALATLAFQAEPEPLTEGMSAHGAWSKLIEELRFQSEVLAVAAEHGWGVAKEFRGDKNPLFSEKARKAIAKHAAKKPKPSSSASFSNKALKPMAGSGFCYKCGGYGHSFKDCRG